MTVAIASPGCLTQCRTHGHGNGHGNGNGGGNGDGQGDGAPPQPASAPPPSAASGCAPAGQACGPPPRCRPWANCHNGHGKGHMKLGAVTLPAAILMALGAVVWPRRRRRRRAAR